MDDWGQQSSRQQFTRAQETLFLELKHVSRGNAAAQRAFSDLEAVLRSPIPAVNTLQDFTATYQIRSAVIVQADADANGSAKLMSAVHREMRPSCNLGAFSQPMLSVQHTRLLLQSTCPESDS